MNLVTTKNVLKPIVPCASAGDLGRVRAGGWGRCCSCALGTAGGRESASQSEGSWAILGNWEVPRSWDGPRGGGGSRTAGGHLPGRCDFPVTAEPELWERAGGNAVCPKTGSTQIPEALEICPAAAERSSRAGAGPHPGTQTQSPGACCRLLLKTKGKGVNNNNKKSGPRLYM